MNKGMIYHRPLSEDAHAIDLDTIVIRLKTAKDDIASVKLMYGDTAFQGNPVLFTELEMKKIACDNFADYYEARIINGFERIVYYFDIYGVDGTHVYYYADIFTSVMTNERNDLFKFPFNRREDIIYIPEWFKKATIYNVFLDSYSFDKDTKPVVINKDNYQIKNKNGGTINGLLNKLDHIQSMGFNTVYLNPIFCAGEYHKYDTIDYMKIDPLFGTNEEFKKLVDEIHNRKMHIIIDGVFNHSGWYFKPFDDVIEKQEKSKYKDWFYNLKFPIHRPKKGEEPRYATFGYERLMPKLNTSNPEVVSYFMEVCRFWMEEFKIDGWRLDVADEVNLDFWRAFKKETKRINPNAVLIGEVWQNAQYFLDGSMFDSVMNYDLLKHAKAFFAKREIDANEFNARITKMLLRYRTMYTYGQMNLLDSHDVPRFFSVVNENTEVFKLAIIFLMTFIGVPSVFYGDEEGLTGIIEDDYRRKPLAKNDELREFYTKIINLRNENEVLTSGKFKAVLHDEDTYIYQYIRYNSYKMIGIVLNNSQQEYVIGDIKEAEIIMSNKYSGGKLGSFGYIIYVRIDF
ncbi:MAG: glycoside hydrolase family 13 protein [Acholeplasma sp.]|nr:glycoside hydrolase family 13 protein [Acholeplasma sp.]